MTFSASQVRHPGPKFILYQYMGLFMYLYVKWVQNDSLFLNWRQIVIVHGHKSYYGIIDGVKDVF